MGEDTRAHEFVIFLNGTFRDQFVRWVLDSRNYMVGEEEGGGGGGRWWVGNSTFQGLCGSWDISRCVLIIETDVNTE